MSLLNVTVLSINSAHCLNASAYVISRKRFFPIGSPAVLQQEVYSPIVVLY